jgi:hypothetical protein
MNILNFQCQNRKSIKRVEFIFIFFIAASLNGCSQKTCMVNNFFSKYERLYALTDTLSNEVVFDLRIKREIFQGLCIDSNVKQLLIVEQRESTQSSYMKGIINVYSDSSFYFFELKKGKLTFGKGLNNLNSLKRISDSLKINFNAALSYFETQDKNTISFDFPIVRVVLFNDLGIPKINSYSFKYPQFDTNW